MTFTTKPQKIKGPTRCFSLPFFLQKKSFQDTERTDAAPLRSHKIALVCFIIIIIIIIIFNGEEGGGGGVQKLNARQCMDVRQPGKMFNLHSLVPELIDNLSDFVFI